MSRGGILCDIGNERRPTNAFALLTDSDRISPVVKCGLFRGKTRAVFIDHRQFELPVQDQIEEAYKYVLSKINLGASFPNIHRKDTYEIPPGAIRELIANAVLHRTYVNAEASPITVAIYDDRLEITSPGKLKRGVTVEKMLEECSDCRNEALALALSYMNIIEDWGSGIPRIRRMLKDAGLRDLVIEDWPNAVRVVVYRSVPETSVEDVQPESRPESRPESHSLDSRILNALVSGAKNRSDIAYSLGQKSGSGQFKKVIVGLLANGMIERTIPDKPNSRLQKYRLTEKGWKMVSC